jgi:hypothetical protein
MKYFEKILLFLFLVILIVVPVLLILNYSYQAWFLAILSLGLAWLTKIRGVWSFSDKFKLLESKKIHIFLVTFLILIGAFLRFYKIDYRNLYTDESTTYIVAKQIIEFGFTNYPRAKFFSYLTAWFVDFFGKSYFSLRLAPVLIGVISLPLFYGISRWITKNKSVALLALYFLSINSWHIATSRAARMYILFGLLFFCLLAIIVDQINKLTNNDHFLKYLKENKYLLLLGVLIFIFSFQTHSATIEILAFIFASFIYLLIFFYIEKRKIFFKWIKFTLASISIIILAFIFVPKLNNKLSYISILENFNYTYFDLFIGSTAFSWLVVPALIFYKKLARKPFISILILGVIAILLAMVFVLDHYIAKRYIFHILLPLTLIVSYLIYYLFSRLTHYRKLVFALIILISIGYNSYSLNQIYNTSSGYLFLDTYAEDYESAMASVDIKNIDGLIGTARSNLDFYQNSTEKIHNYNYEMWQENRWTFGSWKTDKEEYFDFVDFVESNEQGYYFADHRRLYDWENKVPWQIKFYVLENMKKIPSLANDVDIFRW